jgi:hypothetical protein
MSSKRVIEYVQQRINEARQELVNDARKKAEKPMSYEQYDAIADRIARRISQAMRKQQASQPGRYQGKREIDANKPGFQGQYADQLLRESGLYEREWKRLHGEQ